MDGRLERGSDTPGPLWSVLLVPALGLALAACGAVLAAPGHGRTTGGPDTGRLIGLMAAGSGCAVVLVWALTAVLALLAVLAGHHRWERLAEVCGRCSPVLLRRAAAAVLGLQLVAVPAAVADDAPSPFWTSPAAVQEVSAPGPDARAPVPVPDAARDSGAAPARAPAPAPAPAQPCVPRAAPSTHQRTADGAVTVVRGDTLWSLAAAQLGPDATDEQIARTWPRWYELNRRVLVDGPHRLLPGQRLLVPDTGNG